MPGQYIFDGRDRALLDAATALLKRVTRAESVSPGQLVSIAKLQHVLSHLPRVTPGLDVTVQVIGPRHKFGEIETGHYWEIWIEGEQISISSGGVFYQPSTGSDSFTTMNWSVVPGGPAEFRDYRGTLGMVPDIQSFPEGVAGINFESGAYQLDIVDPDNELLDEPDLQTEEETAEASVPEMWSVTPLDAAEHRLITETPKSSKLDPFDRAIGSWLITSFANSGSTSASEMPSTNTTPRAKRRVDLVTSNHLSRKNFVFS
jgi:hypothetical protein